MAEATSAAVEAAQGATDAPAAGAATSPSPREAALMAARAADDKKATDILVQHVAELVGETDYFVIATASNARQVSAIVDQVEDDLRTKAGLRPLHREETRDGSWELLDYGPFVVHVFQPETREYYRLEQLWNDAPVVDLAAEAGIEDVQYSERIAAFLRDRFAGTPSRDQADASADGAAAPVEQE
ncbi:ribosome silencing factor [Eggerthellaceae bacterium zg-1084]|uniref:Ribosomal silencing factor RsfS n=2 Tax=Berryella wangjianweii TaxID=2734634 RepID=A0A6M8J5P4_9ACTN|nr:ribosome silencing factor [Berryella wangjianweii]NPD32547.1 ribosome silencing factor [Eggerthellaceae bacterium zg-997]QKF07943.1 ribosome silencing factor [Berryella wangjianweii]